MKYQIRTGVPIPPKNPRNGYCVAIRALRPGQNVVLTAKPGNARSLIAQMRKRGELAGLRFSLRTCAEGVGIWCEAAD